MSSSVPHTKFKTHCNVSLCEISMENSDYCFKSCNNLTRIIIYFGHLLFTDKLVRNLVIVIITYTKLGKIYKFMVRNGKKTCTKHV
jgi:hypothetical protein